MTIRATGSFEVKLAPLPLGDVAANAGLGRMSLDKTFTGDLEATSKGEMLSFFDAKLGSGGYVALEKVDGKLQGRSGTFVLQHSSIMNRNEPSQSIAVVPDSATGDLIGLTGKVTIKIENQKHFYEFDYTLPDKKN